MSGARKATVTARHDFPLCGSTVAILVVEGSVQLGWVSDAGDGKIVANRFASATTADELRRIARCLDKVQAGVGGVA
ncbi:MAG: hypothetical protein V4659_03970 [Pseudomonadota bacterium]